MTKDVLDFLAGMVKLEMVASVLLLAISIGVVAVLGSVAWFIITKLPKILVDWLTGFNLAIEKIATSMAKMTADVSGTHQYSISAASLLSTHDEQARQIKEVQKELVGKVDEGNAMLIGLVATLENRPCVAKK